ncbi:hypothetical protein ACH5Y9_02770 [Methylomonas sp. BW4-1]|uniref:hypothetical protein n=1 Tax=Methylomonas sp. BW4-1 TaxID=3376685 RepID=UPI004042AC7A
MCQVRTKPVVQTLPPIFFTCFASTVEFAAYQSSQVGANAEYRHPHLESVADLPFLTTD